MQRFPPRRPDVLLEDATSLIAVLPARIRDETPRLRLDRKPRRPRTLAVLARRPLAPGGRNCLPAATSAGAQRRRAEQVGLSGEVPPARGSTLEDDTFPACAMDVDQTQGRFGRMALQKAQGEGARESDDRHPRPTARTRRRVVAEAATQHRGDRAGSGGAGTTQAHAAVLGLDHDADSEGRQSVLEMVGDLAGEPLLGLGAAGEELDGPGQLGQSQDPVGGQVADVRDARERQQVVLAQRADRDVAHQDQLVVARGVVEGGQVEVGYGEQLGVGVDEPAWGLRHVGAGEWKTESGQERGGRSARGLEVDLGPGVGHPEPAGGRPPVEGRLERMDELGGHAASRGVQIF